MYPLLSQWPADGRSVIHRADYHQILLDNARSLGVEIRLGALVEKILVDETAVIVGAETITGDVIIGADGSFLSHPHLMPKLIRQASGPKSAKPSLMNPIRPKKPGT
jgi:flavin-dependent dehydrogenase